MVGISFCDKQVGSTRSRSRIFTSGNIFKIIERDSKEDWCYIVAIDYRTNIRRIWIIFTLNTTYFTNKTLRSRHPLFENSLYRSPRHTPAHKKIPRRDHDSQIFPLLYQTNVKSYTVEISRRQSSSSVCISKLLIECSADYVIAGNMQTADGSRNSRTPTVPMLAKVICVVSLFGVTLRSQTYSFMRKQTQGYIVHTACTRWPDGSLDRSWHLTTWRKVTFPQYQEGKFVYLFVTSIVKLQSVTAGA